MWKSICDFGCPEKFDPLSLLNDWYTGFLFQNKYQANYILDCF